MPRFRQPAAASACALLLCGTSGEARGFRDADASTEKSTLLAWYEAADGDNWCCSSREEGTEPWSTDTDPCPDNGGGSASLRQAGDGIEIQEGSQESLRWVGVNCVNSSVTEIGKLGHTIRHLLHCDHPPFNDPPSTTHIN